MGTGAKAGIGVGVGFGVLVIIGIIAAATPERTSNEGMESQRIINSNEIVGIGEFAIIEAGSMYKAHFNLLDKDVIPVTSNVRVQLVVTLTNTATDDGSVIYSNNFDVRASEFDDYVRILTGAETGKMYLWFIDKSEFSELDQYEYAIGEAVLTVTLPNGKSFTADSVVL